MAQLVTFSLSLGRKRASWDCSAHSPPSTSQHLGPMLEPKGGQESPGPGDRCVSSKQTQSFSKARPLMATTDLGDQSRAHGRQWAERHMTYVPHNLLSLLTCGLGQSGWGWAGSTGPGGICPPCATLALVLHGLGTAGRGPSHITWKALCADGLGSSGWASSSSSLLDSNRK